MTLADSSGWAAVDALLTERLLGADPVLDAASAASAAAGLPPISVSPAQGAFLHLLARSIGARRILEVGTLGGYSAIWLARALPTEGRLVTLEISPLHAEVARANLRSAGLDDRAEVVVGPAAYSLDRMAREGRRPGPFDLVFIDADKPSNADYLRRSLPLCRDGAVIVVDNVVRRGEILAAEPDENARGVLGLLDAIAAEPRLSATAVQTVGEKGWDGFVLAVVGG